jgi:DNA-binding XRE family transcriptional regulator
MADEGTTSWRTLRGQRPLNEQRVALYRQLIEFELNLGEVRRRRGLSQATIAASLDVSQPNISRIEQEDDVHLSTLARYVAALGGQLEVRAVFPEETITLLGERERE